MTRLLHERTFALIAALSFGLVTAGGFAKSWWLLIAGIAVLAVWAALALVVIFRR
jgi:hypothetical protein